MFARCQLSVTRAEMFAYVRETFSRTNCLRLRSLAWLRQFGVYRGGTTSSSVGMSATSRIQIARDDHPQKRHRHAGDRKSFGMRVVLREDRVVLHGATLD